MADLTQQQMMDRLNKRVEEAGSQSAFAQEHAISKPYISDVITGRRDPGKKVLEALGLELVPMYREKANG